MYVCMFGVVLCRPLFAFHSEQVCVCVCVCDVYFISWMMFQNFCMARSGQELDGRLRYMW